MFSNIECVDLFKKKHDQNLYKAVDINALKYMSKELYYCSIILLGSFILFPCKSFINIALFRITLCC